MRNRLRVAFRTTMMGVLLSAAPGRADMLGSEVTDPIGDLFVTSCTVITCQPYQDILSAEIAKRGGIFVLGMSVAEPILARPPLPPQITQIVWSWRFDTDPGTFPAGYPLPAGFSTPIEFIARIIWNGTSFRGELVDRRPLLVGERALITSVPFKIKGAEITVVVDESLIGDPSSFEWHTDSTALTTEFGTAALFGIDNTAFATWP